MKKKHEHGHHGETSAHDAEGPAGQAEATPLHVSAETPVEETVPKAALEAAEKQRDEYLDLAKRARADYVNLQRRMEAQSESARDAVKQEFARDMLTSLDELEMAIKHSREGVDCDGIIKGLELVKQKFLASLARHGIEPIAAEGAPFDHNVHHAIAEHPTDDAAPGTIFAVAQRGYTMGGKLLRPAHVVVTRKASVDEAPQQEGQEGQGEAKEEK
jgi:molecular chaperone GrpE